MVGENYIRTWLQSGLAARQEGVPVHQVVVFQVLRPLIPSLSVPRVIFLLDMILRSLTPLPAVGM